MRKCAGPKRGKVAGIWRKLRIEELDDPYSSSNRAIKPRKTRWAWRLAHNEGDERCKGNFGGET
jgi:hypothetical protein